MASETREPTSTDASSLLSRRRRWVFDFDRRLSIILHTTVVPLSLRPPFPLLACEGRSRRFVCARSPLGKGLKFLVGIMPTVSKNSFHLPNLRSYLIGIASQVLIRQLLLSYKASLHWEERLTEEVQGDRGQQSSSAYSRTKRRKDGEIQKSKFRKVEGDVTMSKVASCNDAQDIADSHPHFFNLEGKLEAQAKALWNLKDDLKKHVTKVELREMLGANGQDSTGSELDLRDRCADGMMFGALASCHICSGSLRYSRGNDRCHSYLSEWSKCSCSTPKPERIKGKLKVPKDTTNEYFDKDLEEEVVNNKIKKETFCWKEDEKTSSFSY